MHVSIDPKQILSSKIGFEHPPLSQPMFTKPQLHCSGSQKLLSVNQEEIFDKLNLALHESFVFAAITGANGTGKSMILRNIMKVAQSTNRICLSILTPDIVTSETISKIRESVTVANERLCISTGMILIAVDDAHKATDSLLNFLTEIADRPCFKLRTQIILTGLPLLWSRLAPVHYTPLKNRLAIRCNI